MARPPRRGLAQERDAKKWNRFFARGALSLYKIDHVFSI